MRTTVTVNDEQHADLAQKVEAADESLRISFAGLGLDEIVPEVERSLAQLDVDLPAETVRAWAQHIRDREDYALHIG
ncbi:hypothetical protein [Aeromicrobium stalagmiti]|uniref:hypothetical protein n=1 Tax=Aeromicrobium stalagmiti TaxID=2738988 RepID=UPI001569236A|nr:hypothetical protein [Aeromicrobium stalagmiti]NRQ50514.1 hypothetical protein [Aeromicrobium stalagmiti]